MRFAIRFRPRVQKQLGALPRKLQQRIMQRIEALADESRPPGAETLTGDLKGRLRMRVGDYRVIYGVTHDPPVVVVYTIGHRRRIYGDAGQQD